MPCDLEQTFEELALMVPTAGEEEYVFSARTLPLPSTVMRTDRLIIKKGLHYYDGCFRADHLDFQASKSTYRQLGLLLLAVLFHPDPPRVHLHLTHPASDIKELIVEFEYKEASLGALVCHPYTFSYFPRPTTKHPWYPMPMDQGLDSSSLPVFYLTYSGPPASNEEEWMRRGTVIGFGAAQGTVLLAELLLNASSPENSVNEYELEGDAGFRGVGPQSAEVRFWLPGSLGYFDLNEPD